MTLVRAFLLTGILLLRTSYLVAQDVSLPVEIHGFGTWVYGRTSNNLFLGGTPEGDYRHTSMGVNVSKQLDDRLSIRAQAELGEDDDGTHTHLSFAFADYKLSDHISFRLGQVKHPFGLHTEVFAVGTLRPFIDLPQSFYGPVGFAGESFKGIGVSGTMDVNTWTIAYDAYGGGNDLLKLATPERYFAGSSLDNVSEEQELQSTRDVLGGRVVVRTSVAGLSFGTSAYTGTLNEPAANHRTVLAAQVAYQTNTWSLESEIAHEDQVRDEQATGGYLLAAYRLNPEWQLAAQYGDLRNQFYNADLAKGGSLTNHREGAFAVSRWFARSLVIKAEYHLVSGNRFAFPHPEELRAIVDANRLHRITHLVQFGAQFSF